MSAALWAGRALLPAFRAVTGALVTVLDLGGQMNARAKDQASIENTTASASGTHRSGILGGSCGASGYSPRMERRCEILRQRGSAVSFVPHNWPRRRSEVQETWSEWQDLNLRALVPNEVRYLEHSSREAGGDDHPGERKRSVNNDQADIQADGRGDPEGRARHGGGNGGFVPHNWLPDRGSPGSAGAGRPPHTLKGRGDCPSPAALVAGLPEAPHMLLTAERIGLHDELSDRAFGTKTMGVDHLPPAIDLVVGSAERAELEAKLAAALASKSVPASRRQRRPLIDAEITRAEKAGKDVAAASISPDGTLSLTFERPPQR
jgi:hypothetical protein